MRIHAVSVWAVIYVSAASGRGRPGRTRQLALGGLSSALILLSLAAATFLPTAKLALFSLGSLALAVAVIELGQPFAWLVYLAVSLLALAWPGLASSWPFLLFFGPYPLIRAVIDSRLPRLAALLLRLGAGTVLAGAAFLVFGRPALAGLAARFGPLVFYLALPLALLGILIYDLVLGMLIQLYVSRLAAKRR